MNDDSITEQEVKRHLDKLKNKKAPGPDGLKSELYKVMADSNIFTKDLTVNLNKIIREADVQVSRISVVGLSYLAKFPSSVAVSR